MDNLIDESKQVVATFCNSTNRSLKLEVLRQFFIATEPLNRFKFHGQIDAIYYNLMDGGFREDAKLLDPWVSDGIKRAVAIWKP